jgi:hypothetical protein
MKRTKRTRDIRYKFVGMERKARERGSEERDIRLEEIVMVELIYFHYGVRLWLKNLGRFSSSVSI